MDSVTLEDVMADISILDSVSHVYIWSGEHREYWMKDGSGYTPDLRTAGAYPLKEAYKMTAGLGPEKKISFIPVKTEADMRSRITALEDEVRRLSEDSLQSQINQWQRKTFPEATAKSKWKHLKKECKELKKDIKKNPKGVPVEAADCAMLLFGIAGVYGFDLLDEVLKKLKINKGRTWGKPDKHGVVEHIESPPTQEPGDTEK